MRWLGEGYTEKLHSCVISHTFEHTKNKRKYSVKYGETKILAKKNLSFIT
jgi:hypothetical protein